MKALTVGLALVAAMAVYYRYEIKFMACLVDSKLTDPPGVRTDGLCGLIYIVETEGGTK